MAWAAVPFPHKGARPSPRRRTGHTLSLNKRLSPNCRPGQLGLPRDMAVSACRQPQPYARIFPIVSYGAMFVNGGQDRPRQILAASALVLSLFQAGGGIRFGPPLFVENPRGGRAIRACQRLPVRKTPCISALHLI